MPDSPYRLRLVHAADGETVTFRAGGAVEADLIELIVSHQLEHGTSVWRTREHLRKGALEALHAFKARSVQAI